MNSAKILQFPNFLDRVKYAESKLLPGQKVSLNPKFRNNYNLMGISSFTGSQVNQIRNFLDREHRPNLNKYEWKISDLRKSMLSGKVQYNAIVEYIGTRRPEFQGIKILLPVGFLNK